MSELSHERSQASDSSRGLSNFKQSVYSSSSSKQSNNHSDGQENPSQAANPGYSQDFSFYNQSPMTNQYQGYDQPQCSPQQWSPQNLSLQPQYYSGESAGGPFTQGVQSSRFYGFQSPSPYAGTN